jgi:hypothetical protein
MYDALDIWWTRRQISDNAANEGFAFEEGQRWIGAPFTTNGRRRLWSDVPSAERASQVSRIDLYIISKREYALVETRVQQLSETRRLVAMQIWSTNLSNEQRVTTQQPRRLVPLNVTHQQTDAIKAMARRMEHEHAGGSNHNFLVIVNIAMRIGDEGMAVNQNDRSGAGGEAGSTRDVVGVGMGLKNVRDLQTVPPGEADILRYRIPARIDDCTHSLTAYDI